MKLQIKFKIEKFYLDCIDEEGNCFIVYWAKVKFLLAGFLYSGLIFCDKDGFATEKSSFRRIPGPVIDRTISLKDHLEADVSLKGIDQPVSLTLYEDRNKNELIWNCHHPKGLAGIRYKGSTYKGYGYSESLISKVKPWNLPISELRWGRFLSDSDTLIWISWKGTYPLNRMFYNGFEYNDAIFKEDIVIFGKGAYQLTFKEIQVIREGVISRLFSGMPHLRMFFNQRILSTLETKYRARTAFSKNTITVSNGWSLFETVIWGK